MWKHVWVKVMRMKQWKPWDRIVQSEMRTKYTRERLTLPKTRHHREMHSVFFQLALAQENVLKAMFLRAGSVDHLH